MVPVTMLGASAMVMGLISSDRLFGRGELLEEMVHPMRRGGHQEKSESGDNT
mgnify:FL=1